MSPDRTHKTTKSTRLTTSQFKTSTSKSRKLTMCKVRFCRRNLWSEHSCSLLGNIPGNIPRSSCIILHARMQARMQDHLVMRSHSTQHETCRHRYRDCTSIHYGRKSNLDQRIRCLDCRSSHLWPCFRPISCPGSNTALTIAPFVSMGRRSRGITRLRIELSRDSILDHLLKFFSLSPWCSLLGG